MTQEAQYNPIFEQPGLLLGPMTTDSWVRDPKHLVFVLARYKFVGKMLAGRTRVLEVGCGDGFGARIVRQHVKSLIITDCDHRFSGSANRMGRQSPFTYTFAVHDYLDGPFTKFGDYDAAYALDVLEHIPPEREAVFLSSITGSMKDRSMAIFGMPSIESQQYASEISKQGHVNCKTAADLKSSLERHFQTVVVMGMQDEMLHCGYEHMRHYLLAMCYQPIRVRV